MKNNKYKKERGMPIKLSNSKEFKWHHQTNPEYDQCHVSKREQESIYPGLYQVTGYDPSRQNCSDYQERLNQHDIQVQQHQCIAIRNVLQLKA